MDLRAYLVVLRSAEVRLALLLSLLIRTPMWAAGIVLTLHVVDTLGRSYGEAGLVVAAETAAIAVSGPWRGRRLDQIGLRATVGPQLVVLVVAWGLAPFVGYLPLLACVVVAGLAMVPSFSVVRQILIRSVSDERRKTALSLDSLVTEITFMAGPALGVIAATYVDTRWALLGFTLLSTLGGLVLWVLNPQITAEAEEGAGESSAERARAASWMTPYVVAVLGAGVASTVVLTASDLGIVAALRDWDQSTSIGGLMAVWGLGSAVGALVYGAVSRSVSVFWLLLALAAVTAPAALAGGRLSLAALLFVAGLLCAPTITATVEALSRAVPAGVRGEVMGWHGSALTVGSALGAPLAGFTIDHTDWRGAFVVPAGLGAVVAVTGLLLRRSRTPRSASRADQDSAPSVASAVGELR